MYYSTNSFDYGSDEEKSLKALVKCSGATCSENDLIKEDSESMFGALEMTIELMLMGSPCSSIQAVDDSAIKIIDKNERSNVKTVLRPPRQALRDGSILDSPTYEMAQTRLEMLSEEEDV
jgi:hypothetical protein